jgi:hypothetical protein
MGKKRADIMATFYSNNTRRKDEPEDLRQLRQAHGSSLSTLKELFADWSEEDLLYAIQDAGGDLESAILRISDGKGFYASLFCHPTFLLLPPQAESRRPSFLPILLLSPWLFNSPFVLILLPFSFLPDNPFWWV